jgi:(p)ppGpp synthase/HD superfamily hydrolase
MNNANLIIEACLFAAKAHTGQTRKYPALVPGVGKVFEAYINHPLEVAAIVARHGGSDEMIAAAVLHDTLEDCKVTPTEILDKFGERVIALVWQVTNQSKAEDGNRKIRKQIDLRHLQHATPEGKTIKLADIYSNLKDIAVKDPDFAGMYMEEKLEVLEVLKDASSPSLHREVAALINGFLNSNI